MKVAGETLLRLGSNEAETTWAPCSNQHYSRVVIDPAGSSYRFSKLSIPSNDTRIGSRTALKTHKKRCGRWAASRLCVVIRLLITSATVRY